jgi:hypothetical protein
MRRGGAGGNIFLLAQINDFEMRCLFTQLSGIEDAGFRAR